MTSTSKYSDLSTRMISAFVMLIIAGVSISIGGLLFEVVLLAVAFCIMWEIAGLSHGDQGPRVAISVIFAAALGAGYWTSWPLAMGIYLACLVGYIILLKPKDKVLRCALSALALGGLITLAELRNDVGLVPTFWVIACVIASDVGGYFAGRTFGGPKLWPAVSPKKTWSGTIGGWVLAIIVTIGFMIFTQGFGLGSLFWAVIIAVFAQIGDLAESALKRRAGVKDSSNLIPGHGGFLDRFDGMLGAFFFVFLAFVLNFQNWLF
jgi:phosphatidate cytidylyltransferase